MSERLILRLMVPDDADELLRYFTDNRAHLEPWEPQRPAEFYTRAFWQAQIDRNGREFLSDQSVRLVLARRDAPEAIVGTVSFTAITRGVAQSCNLGYSLAAAAQGHGYLSEILPEAIAYVFGPLNLHRIQANYMPHNRRSGALLRRLGFVVEGYARDYLYLAGHWEDHLLTSLSSQSWQEPALR